jgi:hypothetical protein
VKRLRGVVATLVAAILAAVVPAAAQTETLTAVCTGPWEVKLNLTNPLNVPADELIEVPAANTEWGYAVYGVFKAGDDTATLLVDLTPVSMYQAGNSTVEISTQFMVWYLAHKPRVYCRHCKCNWFWAIEEQSPTLLALALEPKRFPIGETLTLVNPDNVQIELNGQQVTLTRDVLEKVCEAVATYEYDLGADVGLLQYVVFKNLLTYLNQPASTSTSTSTTSTTTSATATATTSTSTATATATTTESTENTSTSTSTTTSTSTNTSEVEQEAAQLAQQFAQVNSSTVQEEISDALSQLGVVIQQIASNPQVQQAASTASNLFQSVPLFPVALLGLVVPVFARRR